MINLALVTVVIPSFNRGSLLGETLDSILGQSHTNWECIIVDDGSSDNTGEVALAYCKRDSRFRYVQRTADRKKGANTCRNIGFELSNGEWIKWLDSDDLLDKDCLKKQVELIGVNGADVCFAQTNYFSSKGGSITFLPNKVWGKVQPSQGEDLATSYIFKGVRWQPGAVLWRKKFLDNQPFLEGLQNSQEWLMHYKYLLKKPKACFINESLCHARVHQGSMSNAGNKRGNYYYHQCIARLEALSLLDSHHRLHAKELKKMIKFILWNHLFIFYKGAPLKGLAFLRYYPKLLTYLFNAKP